MLFSLKFLRKHQQEELNLFPAKTSTISVRRTKNENFLFGSKKTKKKSSTILFLHEKKRKKEKKERKKRKKRIKDRE